MPQVGILLAPFFTRQEREHGCQHRFFMTQVEYCHNLIFRRRAVLDTLHQRLLDANRSMGQPDKITLLFGRKVTKSYRGRLTNDARRSEFGEPRNPELLQEQQRQAVRA